MTAVHLGSVLHHVRRLSAAGEQVPDADLVRRFAAAGEAAAFAALLGRHGRMVWATVRHHLRHEQDAEDAFQAAFLVLARKAGAIRKGQSVGSFLHGVAYRAALRVRRDAARRRQHERRAAEMPRAKADSGTDWREVQAVLDEEVQRLPEAYRTAFVACCLEGEGVAAAARRLGWKQGTLSARLARARALLRRRLTRRGVSLSAVLCAAALAPAAASAVPSTLTSVTLTAALRTAAGDAAVSASVAAVADGVGRAVAQAKLKMMAGLLLAVGVAVGAGALAHQAGAVPRPAKERASDPAQGKDEPTPADRDGDPLPAEALSRVGSARLRHGAGAYAVAFSPDGKWVGSAGEDRTARVWDAVTGRCRLRVEVRGGGRCCHLRFAPDSRFVAVLDAESYRAFDLETGKERSARPFPGGPAPCGAAVAPDGKTFVIAREGQPYRLCDAGSGKELRPLTAAGGWDTEAAFSPDGKFVALTSPAGRRGALEVYDTASGQALCKLPGLQRVLSAPAFAPDGKTVAALSLPGDGPGQSVTLWDVAGGRLVRRITGLELTASCIAFSPDGKLLAVGNLQRTSLQLFDVTTGKEVRRLRCWPSVMQLAFSPDGTTIAAAKSEGTVTLQDARTGAPRSSSADPGSGIGEVRFLDGGRSLLTVGGEIEARDWRTGRVLRRYADPRKDNVCGLSLSPDGRVVAACDWNGDVRLADGRTGAPLRTLEGHTNSVVKSLFSPDARTLFTSGFDGTVRVWAVATGKELRRLTAGKGTSLNQLAVSADGKTLAASAAEGDNTGRHAVRVWDLRQGNELCNLPLAGPAWGLVFSPDGTLLAAAVSGLAGPRSGGPVVLWDVTTGSEVWAQKDLGGSVFGVAFSPDGRALATGGDDRKVRLWEVASGKQRHVFEGHQGAVGPLAFSPDGRLLASSSLDAPVFVWDVTGTVGRRPPAPLKAAERGRLWDALAGADAEAAFQAMRRMAVRPDDAISLVRDRLRPAAAHDTERLRRLLRDLDADDFAMRERATAELSRVAEQVEGSLRSARAGASPEARRRLDTILRGLKGPSPERLRQTRALEVLEWVGTPPAREVLRSLAGGAQGPRLTRDAEAALRRLAGRASPSQ